MRFWLFLTGVLLFAAGGAVGFVAAGRFGGEGGRPEPPFGGFDPEAFARLLNREEVYRKLELSEAQRSRIDSLLSEKRDREREIRRAMEKLAADLRPALLDVLTPEQKNQFEQIRTEIEEREIQERINREIEQLRGEIALTPEQETKVVPVLLDAARAKSDCFKSRDRSRGWEEMREKLEEINKRRLERLAELLTPEQVAGYSKFKEREHRPGPGRPRR